MKRRSWRTGALVAAGSAILLVAATALSAAVADPADGSQTPSTSPADGAAASDSPSASVGAAAPASASVQILSITPRLPAATKTGSAMAFTVLVKAGATALQDAELTLRRGNPMTTERELTAALAKAPPTEDVDIAAVQIPTTIPAGQQRQVVLTSTTFSRTDDGGEGLCLTCNPGVYPVDVTLTAGDDGDELARTHTFIPSFQSAPQPVQVSWVWPLLDRPHRTVSRTVFDDDELAASVAPGGRLYRALQVPELVAGKVRLTLVVDPDLLDSLVVMSTTKYQVRDANGVLTPGTGSAAATQWLSQLTAMTHSHDIVRTAYADPDVDSLARSGVNWSSTLDAQAHESIKSTLGVDPGNWLAWPVAGQLSSQGLDSIVGNGASAALLADADLPASLGQARTPSALAPLPSATGNATAVVLSSTLEGTLTKVITDSDPGSEFVDSQLLLAQLAIRAEQDPQHDHYVALAPTRYVDADPQRVAGLMTTIATAPFAADLSLTSALASLPRVDHGSLGSNTSAGGLSAGALAALGDARSRLDAFRECLSNQDAATVLGEYPAALARATSSFFRDQPVAEGALTNGVRDSIINLTAQVRITSPDNGNYTLASSDAPLFLTVENKLAVLVRVSLTVQPAPGEKGLVVKPVAVQNVPPGIHQFKVDTQVERTGRFKVELTLVSPSGKPLGEPTQIRVKSTAFGAVALWITGIAFAILLIALTIRTIRRIRHRLPRPPREAAITPTGAI